MLTVGFAQLGVRDWHGGQSLVSNAIRALHAYAPDRVRCMIVGDAGPETEAYARASGADGVVAYVAPPVWSPHRVASAALVRLRQHNLSLEWTLRQAGVQVVVSESVAWRLGSVASIGWLQDFQHRALPELFDAGERVRRERSFRCTMRLADRLLATESVAADARAFAPEFAHKLRIVRQYTIIEDAVYQRDPMAVVGTYGLPERFVYVPNQFWIHKNHGLLFEALRQLRERRVEPQVVLTGRAEDYRDPSYFSRLMRKLDEWQLTQQVRYLGVIPKADVMDLIRQSICIVNPSLFEGWGYAADEAAAIGKRMLISELAAHREQANAACELFDPRDASELAAKLERIWAEAQPGPAAQLETAARGRRSERVRALGQPLLDAIEEAVAAPTARVRGAA